MDRFDSEAEPNGFAERLDMGDKGKGGIEDDC